MDKSTVSKMRRTAIPLMICKSLPCSASVRCFWQALGNGSLRIRLEFEQAIVDVELGMLAFAPKGTADRAAPALDDAMDFVDASEKRIAALEAKVTKL